MLETVKEQVWELLKEKDISLAMIYNKKGEILWNRGRPIRGKNVHQGEGFCKGNKGKGIMPGKLFFTDGFREGYPCTR
jgi:hypothetical protein